jgi:SAM-dependent methyltransferase
MVGTVLPLDEIFEWDVDNWSKCLPYWEPWLTRLDRDTARILALGERDGGLSLWFALQGFKVLCTDYHIPGEQARLSHERWMVQDRVAYAAVDAFNIPYPENYFDVVACKSVIGGLVLQRKMSETRTLENQRLAVEEIRRVLKPGGVFLGAENLTGTKIHRFLRWMKYGPDLGWRYLRTTEIQWLFESYSVCQQKQWGLVGSPWWKFGSHWWKFDRLNPLLRVIDVCLSNVLPGDWLYISFIRARK